MIENKKRKEKTKISVRINVQRKDKENMPKINILKEKDKERCNIVNPRILKFFCEQI